MACVENNAHRAVGLAEIAAAAFVTERAIQYALRHQVSITPLGYLRRLRLERVRTQLRAADPRTANIGAIAASWGSVHQGRSAAAYREVYGVPPSQTLHSTDR
ncbi:AraC family transcriptional regulator [Streptomyces solincola]|uniref:AraC family transcriptional regulator n=1 Tax=Streptomyces solincola TaxID=2100817 RepID=A0A2S9Q138_9ACTN|nr:helix-turn-helix domain-containing protein [Streptomyces solincola]PRH80389.1 AraC family transcriptional regulator [Streptomyces solincola]